MTSMDQTTNKWLKKEGEEREVKEVKEGKKEKGK